MISLRISEEEYDSLKQCSEDYGARSISELARMALHLIMGQNGQSNLSPMELRLNDFDGRLKAIELRMAEMTGRKA